MKIFPIILVCLGSVLGPMEASASPPAKTPNIAIAEADFYVSPDGDDRNPGSSDAPFLTFFKARDAVRKLKQTKTTGDILVYFKGGQYVLKGTVDTPVTDIVLKGLTFTKGQRYSLQEGDAGTHSDWDIYDKDNALVRLRGAERVVVEACRFFNSGDNAIRLDLHCQNNLVRNNSISHMGRSGVVLCGYGPGTKYANKIMKLSIIIFTIWEDCTGME